MTRENEGKGRNTYKKNLKKRAEERLARKETGKPLFLILSPFSRPPTPPSARPKKKRKKENDILFDFRFL